jgi:arylsulfatase A-like enzyme
LPLLKGEPREPHATLAWFWSGNRAIRQADWKLVWDSRVRRWELYDLSRDRCETRDLAAEQPRRVEAMAADWFAWAAKVELKVKD